MSIRPGMLKEGSEGITPSDHPFTVALIRSYHTKYLHAGPRLTIEALRQKFWIVRGQNIVKKVIRQCTKCFRRNPKILSQPVGELPVCRVEQNYPFYNTGVDFAGPVSLQQRNRRSTVTYKGYIAVFICMATRAIHLELVGDLTSEAFIGALQRFIGRRALPAEGEFGKALFRPVGYHQESQQDEECRRIMDEENATRVRVEHRSSSPNVENKGQWNRQRALTLKQRNLEEEELEDLQSLLRSSETQKLYPRL
ncbi:uncharacterized protein LOC129741588 [Uranotaenia lowii]|uniref:uncharacterized protein LOC129741588 n=1 Tax=Uranotaenia lowii TaxID=190385 RepID=UPI002479C0D8|nr:uncharacterized protein LOC129741588 [Uranotaenia lowii]